MKTSTIENESMDKNSTSQITKVGWRNSAMQVITLLCILLFVYAAMSKLLDYGKFKVQIGQAAPLRGFAGVLALAIPVVELNIAGMLVVGGRFRRWGLIAFTGLMIAFTFYIIWAYYFSPNTPCSCGGVLESLGWVEHIWFNIGFIALSLAGIYLSYLQRKEGRDKQY